MPVKNKWLALLALGILLAIAFGPTLNHFFLSDDFGWLTRAKNHSLVSPLIESFSYSGIFRPIFYLYVQTNYSLFGTSPFGWNLLQLLLHFANCLFLAGLVGKLLKNIPMGLFVATSFALHFINVETVFWLSAASYALATFFVLLTLFLYVQFKETSKKLSYFASLLSALLALFSNEQAMALFLMLVVLEFRFPASMTARFRTLLPHFLVIGLYAGFRFFALDFRPPGGVYHPVAGLNFLKNYLFLMVGSLFRMDFMELINYWRTFQAGGCFIELISNLAGKPAYLFALICTPLAYMTAFRYSPNSRFFILLGFSAFVPVAIFPGTGERLLYLSQIGLAGLIPIWIHKSSEKFGSKKAFYALAVAWISYLFTVQQLTLKNWKFAANVTRNSIETIGQISQLVGQPITVCVERAPDHYHEAWVFRMGFEQLGELFYPEGQVETKLRPEQDCPTDSNRLLYLGKFKNYQLNLKPAAQK